MRLFLDSNVLLYAALPHRIGDEAKRERALALIDSEVAVISMQVIQEFYNQARHPARKHGLSKDEADAFVSVFRQLEVQETTLALMDAGIEILERCKTSFWDAMIIAAARAQGCEVLYSEDLQDGRIIDGMRIVNPFR